MAKKSQVVKFRKKPRAAIIIFLIIFVYVIAFVWLYSTKKKVQTYEVNVGTLTANSTFSGIAVRQESIVYSSYNGDVNYYLREGTKAKVGDTIYSVDETGRVAEILSDASNSDSSSLSQDNLSIIKSTLNSFKTSYSSDDFGAIYDLKTDLNSTVLQSLNESIMANLDAIVASTGSENLFRTIKTEQSGIVVYAVDGYEDFTEDKLSKDIFNKNAYSKDSLNSQKIIVSGNPAYKLVTSEDWSIYIQLSQSDIDSYDLTNKSTVQIRFLKDGLTTSAGFSLIRMGDDTYGRFTLDKYMIRYATDRFLDIELQASTVQGLKIPVSAIVEKEFYIVPEDYIQTGGGNTSTQGLLRRHYVNNELITEFTSVDVYATENGYCYIDVNALDQGDILEKTQSAETHVVGAKGTLKGVYCANTGYTVFNPIEIMEQNAEYCIIKRNTSYGVSVYDHIILDASNVGENEMIY